MSNALLKAQRRDTLTRLGVPEWQADMILGGSGDDDLVRSLVADFRNGPATHKADPSARVTLPGAPEVRSVPDHAPGRGWVEPASVDHWKPPGLSIMDAMLDQQDATDRAAREREFAKRGAK